jgi:predicted site-specific integrase-resolvase
MNTQSIPAKFMRPRQYAQRVGVNWRTAYRYIDEGLWPAYKFQGVLLVDVEEVDAILKGLVRRVPVKEKRVTKSLRKANPKTRRSNLQPVRLAAAATK